MKSADEKPYRSTRFVTLEPTAASPHPRFDRFVITFSRALATSNAPVPSWRSGRCHRGSRRPIDVSPDQHGPDDTCHLVGQRDADQAGWTASEQSLYPFAFTGCLLPGVTDHTGGSCHQQTAQIGIA